MMKKTHLNPDGTCPHHCERYRKPRQRAISEEAALRERERKATMAKNLIGSGDWRGE